MKYTMKNMLALLIVFSATLASAGDSANMATNCRIVEEEKQMYRVEFVANEKQSVKIEIWDQYEELVYQNRAYASSFVKTFDLSHLPNGEYELKLTADDYDYSEAITINSLEGMSIRFIKRDTRKISMVGSKFQEKGMSLYILDENKEIVYKNDYDDETQVHKIFNFDKLEGDEVTFILFHDNEIVTEEKIRF